MRRITWIYWYGVLRSFTIILRSFVPRDSQPFRCTTYCISRGIIIHWRRVTIHRALGRSCVRATNINTTHLANTRQTRPPMVEQREDCRAMFSAIRVIYLPSILHHTIYMLPSVWRSGCEIIRYGWLVLLVAGAELTLYVAWLDALRFYVQTINSVRETRRGLLSWGSLTLVSSASHTHTPTYTHTPTPTLYPYYHAQTRIASGAVNKSHLDLYASYVYSYVCI